MPRSSLGRALRNPGKAAARAYGEFLVPSLRAVSFAARHRWRGSPTLFAFPAVPVGPGSLLAKICCALALAPTDSSPETAIAHVYWEDETEAARPPAPIPLAGRRYVNARCLDIRKSHVDAVFEATAGYGLTIDRATYEGPAVRKSESTARHEGVVIADPLNRAAEPGYVYQRLVDNRVGDTMVEDVRLVVCGGSVPLAYLEYRPQATRFSNQNAFAKTVPPRAALSVDEIDLTLAFADAIGLDFGELDVLRDRRDGRIYVVDVNKTPYGPPNGLPANEARTAVRTIAATFQQAFVSPT